MARDLRYRISGAASIRPPKENKNIFIRLYRLSVPIAAYMALFLGIFNTCNNCSSSGKISKPDIIHKASENGDAETSQQYNETRGKTKKPTGRSSTGSRKKLNKTNKSTSSDTISATEDKTETIQTTPPRTGIKLIPPPR